MDITYPKTIRNVDPVQLFTTLVTRFLFSTYPLNAGQRLWLTDNGFRMGL